MAQNGLPPYLALAKPNPATNRQPWFKGTAPTYAGIFLWVAFYMKIANGTLPQAGLGLSLLGLVLAAVICHFFFYLVPGMFGMKTGYPLYVVGSSTYGTMGGFLMPGLLMGILQFGWLGVNTAVSSSFIIQAGGGTGEAGTVPFIIVAIVWGLAAAFVGVKGIQYVAKVATYLPIVPLVMLLIVFFTNIGGVGSYEPAPGGNALNGMLLIITVVVGFFATAGAAGTDFGTGSRNRNDVRMGGLIGIALAIVVAGGLPLIAIAGAHGKDPTISSYVFDAVIKAQGGFLAKIMFILFAIASFAPACFSSLIAANSIGTMFPKANKMALVLIGAVVSIVLAATGVALDLEGVFGIIGASFGPICGSMMADYLLSGKKWAGPRTGINWAGYIAWAVGFVVGILRSISGETFGWIPVPPVLAFAIGFILYWVLAKAGLEPPAVTMPAGVISGEDAA
ncbi:MAG: cytosine permease [Planctomycetes bacterium]|nr:cytosine permease [Planctomycetota bacterium]